MRCRAEASLPTGLPIRPPRAWVPSTTVDTEPGRRPDLKGISRGFLRVFRAGLRRAGRAAEEAEDAPGQEVGQLREAVGGSLHVSGGVVRVHRRLRRGRG